MCLAVPMEIKSIDQDLNIAYVEISGINRKVRLDIIDYPAKVGDYVIIHAGFALRRLDREDALETIKLFQEGFNFETN
ncbi:hydrogenase expression/formation protein HypC [Desulfonatronum thiosulfatophilum]|uniref:Hydrogenase expression/formation protein HypC n=1 Tax=Desulfonatronum thiosulfatophilum TaxID=617002 RepID=A0A1G6A8D0_9BACT|nr:HypC/HybG/HupF family hydrogenase formation chaperone [Desulfonatronum thiosulfatophilum]SDB04674.1 hydrogenase expression/formation protein HypC [Desulfonatronum thiosulfatophilum]